METRWAKPVLKVSQQALSVFLLNMWQAHLAGMGMGTALDTIEQNIASVAAIILIGLGCVVGFAYLVSCIKSLPWQAAAKRAESKPQPVPDG